MNGECHHIGLFSRDPNGLVSFYVEKMGFQQLGTKTISEDWMTRIFGLQASCQLIKLRLGSAILEIFAPSPGAENVGSRITAFEGYNHWALGVNDKESFVHDLEARGVPLVKLQATERFIYFVKDPEGNLIEIYQSEKMG
jgi:catechol 2,3-dioxygenase-like lactoylglutathione lyase family enzyme